MERSRSKIDSSTPPSSRFWPAITSVAAWLSAACHLVRDQRQLRTLQRGWKNFFFLFSLWVLSSICASVCISCRAIHDPFVWRDDGGGFPGRLGDREPAWPAL